MALLTPASVPHSSLLDMSLGSANESRLQELFSLYRRQHADLPGPGAHDIVAATRALRPRKSFRRPQRPELDGPFPLAPGQVSTRLKQMAKTLATHDSGLGPGEYNAALASIDAHRGHRIGTGCREARMKQVYGLSVSQTINYGLDWHCPVSVSLVHSAGTGTAENPLRLAEGHAMQTPAWVTRKPVRIPCALNPAAEVSVDTMRSSCLGGEHSEPGALRPGRPRCTQELEPPSLKW